MEYENPDRRPYWLNVESPESCFGLLAFDPGEKELTVKLDGNSSEWEEEELVIEHDGLRISAKSDAAYLYLMVEGERYDFAQDTLYVPLDVLSGQGSTRYGNLSFADGAEFLLRLHGPEDSALLVDAYYDVFQYDYAAVHDFFLPVPGQNVKDSGCFDRIYLAMNRPQYLPETGVTTEFERFETGALHYGNGDPESPCYDSLADFCTDGNCIEIRLPWMLLGFMDPSQKQVMGDFNTLNAIEGVSTDGVRIGICQSDSWNETPMELYTWENWDMPQVHERLKRSYHILQNYFAENK